MNYFDIISRWSNLEMMDGMLKNTNDFDIVLLQSYK